MSDISENKSDRAPSVYPDHIMLSISKDPTTTATVTWRTDVTVQKGYIEYKKVGSEKAERINAFSKYIKSDLNESYVHFATPKGLLPDTKYLYTVGNDEYRSDEYTFLTAPLELTKFKFLIITDWQNADPWEKPDYEPVRKLLLDAFKKHTDCRFILSIGDNSDDGQNEAQWNGVFYGLKGIVESIPLMMATGNHDNRGYLTYAPVPTGKFYINHADLFDEKFEYSYPKNGPLGYETENFSFDYGNAHFSVIGINAQHITGEWLYNDLKNCNKTWKIGAYHFPIYPVMPEGVNDDSYPDLKKGIEEGRLDILFAGHEHSFARTFPIKDEQIYDRPSQGTVHYIAGNAGENVYCSNCQKIWHSAFYPQEERVGLYCIAEIDGAKMKVTAYTTDGRIADELIIDKENDIIKPYALAPVYKQTKMAYKGRMLELEAREMYCQEKDGIWFFAFPVLAQGIGGRVIKTETTADVTLYKTRAIFTLYSDIAETDYGEVKLTAPVYSYKGQLYIPVMDAAKIFNMEWSYSLRNNFFNFNCQTEEKPLI